MRTTLRTLGLLGLLAPSPASASATPYVWPSKYDQLDDILYLQSGYIKVGTLSDQVLTCSFGASAPGIQKAAEWVRTAFHDTITHNRHTQTGGLVASIQYELDRPENKGAALNNTLGDIASLVSVRNSAADLLALAFVMAVAKCGDMRVPLRLGRQDASGKGEKGVPEAWTDVETTRGRFEEGGFGKVDTITLIACGHSIGGVHSIDHPEIVSSRPISASNKPSFDTSSGLLDNAVVLEYLNSSTTNPLVTAQNSTLQSDRRIFSLDNNATISKLADARYFKKQCSAVFTKLLNNVPSTVKLTQEALSPADIRPYISTYALSSDEKTVELAGRIRVRTTPVTGRDANSLTVSLLPLPFPLNSSSSSTVGNSSAKEIRTTAPTYLLGQTSGYLDEMFQWFEFNTTVPATELFGAFNIRVNGKVYDNSHTGGYPLRSDILFQAAQSCVELDKDTSRGTLKVVTAVSKGLLARGKRPVMRVVKRVGRQGFYIPELREERVGMGRVGGEEEEEAKGGSGYVWYRGTAVLEKEGLETEFSLEVEGGDGGGGDKGEWVETRSMLGRECKAV
ncbi:WSC domain-containing [Pyrenophora seminiperda CCB06]|uniref:Peroxidase n=1 Tax=Pyrenophora seminiperda CCB06 TaxID=1302712 RepID=A0A3M7MGT1_9PLEO|nr:WSC domain-containing [Pyrenophora seminiperda CCB06]